MVYYRHRLVLFLPFFFKKKKTFYSCDLNKTENKIVANATKSKFFASVGLSI